LSLSYQKMVLSLVHLGLKPDTWVMMVYLWHFPKCWRQLSWKWKCLQFKHLLGKFRIWMSLREGRTAQTIQLGLLRSMTNLFHLNLLVLRNRRLDNRHQPLVVTTELW